MFRQTRSQKPQKLSWPGENKLAVYEWGTDMDEITFIKKYSEAIHLGNAAVFAGAGLSAASGFVNWKKLLEPLAKEIGLSMDQEHDYLAVAQYYYNRKKTRASINDTIYNLFTSEPHENRSLEIITRLPIRTYWTTNYDHLLEDALRANNRKPDIKITKENLALNMRDASATVYKMHGDVQFPDQIVLIKNDYETYGIVRNVFTTVLKGHLMSKTFLFVGFSFEDPNLTSILAWIKALLGDDVKEHYCLLRRVSREEGESKAEFVYRQGKQDFFIEDLKRYGIETVQVKAYDDIPRILGTIEKQCNLRNLFLSGSISVDTASWTVKAAEEFARKFSSKLVSKKLCITSGYGLGIGSAVISGVLDEVNRRKYAHFDDYLKLYPFPQSGYGNDLKAVWHDYRKEILAKCRVAIFMFGNKKGGSGNCATADGMLEEYEIADAKQAVIIPLASTEGAALEIYNRMLAKKAAYPYLKKYWEPLKTEKSPEKIAEMVIEIIDSASVQ